MHELVSYGVGRYEDRKNSSTPLKPTGTKNADKYYNDIDRYPHIFVLVCLMDRQIKAETAWMIPYDLCSYLATFEMGGLAKATHDEIADWFAKNRPHRYNARMADVFYEAVQRIHDVYNDDASKIWDDCPNSAAVVYRFLQFKGAGVKIATMAANLLVRDYHVEMADYCSIDISPDAHVRRIFHRLGLTPSEGDPEMMIYEARELYPRYPGIIDVACWEIGREYCHPKNPDCESCPMSRCCPTHEAMR